MSTKTYIFGYGSLVVPEDIFVTLGHRVKVMYPYVLQGWVRDWSAIIDTQRMTRRFRLQDLTEPPYVAALNVRQPRDEEVATNPNGVLFEVSAADLALLDVRESHYRRVDVTEDVPDAPAGIIYTYTAAPECTWASPDDRSIIVPGSYCDLVGTGFVALGEAMHQGYVATTRLPYHETKTTTLG